ncbi:MAG: CHAT domain-containing protein [Saprospiraceae bacterium]|nr:CHAT domain-containing protein [Saprospiraceae bacterium]
MKTLNKFIFIMSFIPSFVFSQIVDTNSVIKEVNNLISESRKYSLKRDLNTALKLLNDADSLCEVTVGKESVIYAKVIFNIGRVHFLKMDYAAAEKGYFQALEIYKQKNATNDEEYPAILMQVSVLYRDQHKYELAENYCRESLILREKIFGINSKQYCSSLISLANIFNLTNRFKEAESIYLEVKDFYKKNLGDTHPDYIVNLHNLAYLYIKLEKFEEAEIHLMEAKSLLAMTEGTNSGKYATCINTLGILYSNMAMYEIAKPLYLEAKEIFEQLVGKKHPLYIACIQNLVGIYFKIGEFEISETYQREMIVKKEEMQEKDIESYALGLNNLAGLYLGLGNYKKAEALYLEAKEINESKFGRNHDGFVSNIANLAILYFYNSEFEKAEIYYKEALQINEELYGSENLKSVAYLENLAILYKTTGRYDLSESYFMVSKRIIQTLLGVESRDYARSLKNLATLYVKMNLDVIADSLFNQANKLLEKQHVKNDVVYRENLLNMAKFYEMKGLFKRSEPLFQVFFELEKERLRHGLTFLSERELVMYMNSFKHSSDFLVSAYLNRVEKKQEDISNEMLTLLFDNILFQRAFALNSASKINSLAKKSGHIAEDYLRLKGYKRQLSIEYTLAKRNQNKIDTLEDKANEIEKKLIRDQHGFLQLDQIVNYQDILGKIGKDEVVVEFLDFNRNEIDSLKEKVYSVLLLRGGWAKPVFVYLCSERSLDSVLNDPVGRVSGQKFYRDMYSISSDQKDENINNALLKLIWKPMSQYMEGIKKIYYSASGIMHRVNLSAIPLTGNQTLGEKIQIVSLSSSKQLFQSQSYLPQNNNAILFGGIHYSQDSTDLDTFSLVSTRSHDGVDNQSNDNTLPNDYWKMLPWTIKEISAIGNLLESSSIHVKLITGKSATEDAFKKIENLKSSPRILHIATHGYFFPDPNKEVDNSQLAVSGEEPVFKISEHPMLRSGLILAGGNAGWKGQQTLEGREDGVLTAYEISQMNLSNTELVVLSACETGLGDIKGNEGVYGLQRAFKIAGAKYLMMSLWQVPDRETKEFMVSFYKNWLTKKKSIPEAFRMTQKEMRERFINPYAWAGFVLVE